jgi:hypothetical protein
MKIMMMKGGPSMKLDQIQKIAAIAIAFALAFSLSPLSAGAATISADMSLSYGEGGTYYSYNYFGPPSSHPAYEMDVQLTAADLGLTDYTTYGYCVDVWEGIPYSMTYPVELTYLSDFDDTYYEIAWLMDTFAGETGVTSDIEAMALQSLIWATLTDQTRYYRPSSHWSSDVRDQYDIYANQLASLNLDPTTRQYLEDHYMVAVSEGSRCWEEGFQDFMVRIPGGGDKVPEPATVVLLGTGLLGLAVLRFGKRG